MVEIDNHIYIFGGGIDGVSYNDLYKIDINNNYTSEKITLNGDIPYERFSHSMVAIDWNIYIVGGLDGFGGINITNDLFIITLNIENDVSPNTGNGGNGANVGTGIFNLNSSGGSGGSGIVIIRKSEIDPSKLYLYKPYTSWPFFKKKSRIL